MPEPGGYSHTLALYTVGMYRHGLRGVLSLSRASFVVLCSFDRYINHRRC